MNQLLLILLLALTVITASAQTVSYNGTRQDLIIDVRTQAEFDAGHVVGALNIPHDRIGVGIRSVKGIRKDSRILLYCRSGRRSAMALDVLVKQGYRQAQDGGAMAVLEPKLKSCANLYC